MPFSHQHARLVPGAVVVMVVEAILSGRKSFRWCARKKPVYTTWLFCTNVGGCISIIRQVDGFHREKATSAPNMSCIQYCCEWCVRVGFVRGGGRESSLLSIRNVKYTSECRRVYSCKTEGSCEFELSAGLCVSPTGLRWRVGVCLPFHGWFSLVDPVLGSIFIYMHTCICFVPMPKSTAASVFGGVGCRIHDVISDDACIESTLQRQACFYRCCLLWWSVVVVEVVVVVVERFPFFALIFFLLHEKDMPAEVSQKLFLQFRNILFGKRPIEHAKFKLLY